MFVKICLFIHKVLTLSLGLLDQASSCFHISIDYIFFFAASSKKPPTSAHLGLLPHGIVVELSSLRSLAADCLFLHYVGFDRIASVQFFLLSLRSQLSISRLCCRLNGFKGFQQFKWLLRTDFSICLLYILQTKKRIFNNYSILCQSSLINKKNKLHFDISDKSIFLLLSAK